MMGKVNQYAEVHMSKKIEKIEKDEHEEVLTVPMDKESAESALVELDQLYREAEGDFLLLHDDITYH